MTPTGQIRTGDSEALKQALQMVNALDRTDIVFMLPLSAGWLSQEHLTTQIIKVIDRSRHPVALAFTASTNPIASPKRLRAYRRIFQQTTGVVMAHRTDLAGFDAFAHGAITSAIGAYPRMRRLDPVGATGSAVDPEDMSPHMLVGDMLRFVRSKHMRRFWFAEAPAFNCFCEMCLGEAIDRLYGSDEERITGHLHNVQEIGRLHSTFQGLDAGSVHTRWVSHVRGAIDTYPQLESLIGAPLKIPADLEFWSSTLA